LNSISAVISNGLCACEEKGWKLAGTVVPIAYTAWSVWLVVTGIVLLA